MMNADQPLAAELDVNAEASLLIRAPAPAVWAAVADLGRRPTLKSWEPLDGTWPEELATARTTMDKGATDMVRIEKVVRCVEGERLLLKVSSPEHALTAWLDHRIADAGEATRLTMGVIVAALLPAGAGSIDRAAYAAGSTAALVATLEGYRDALESVHV